MASELAQWPSSQTVHIQLPHLHLAVRLSGEAHHPALVLIHGLGQTSLDWPNEFIALLVDAGWYVVTFDNRDIGGSTRLDHLGSPPLGRLWLASRLGMPQLAPPPYTLREMAGDVAGLTAALGITQAHYLGFSMGGMIAQHMALAYPDQVRSLCCVASSSGTRGLPAARRDVGELLDRRSDRHTLDAATAQALKFRLLVAGDLTDADCSELTARTARGVRHSWPTNHGAERQYAAVLADRSRAEQLGALRCPTLVLHGALDPFLPPGHGADLAQRVPGATLITIPRMGHELPLSKVPELVLHITAHLDQAGAGASLEVMA